MDSPETASQPRRHYLRVCCVCSGSCEESQIWALFLSLMAEEKPQDISNDGALRNPPSRCLAAGDIDSSCSTPYASAPSSPSRGAAAAGYFHSAPASPTHFILLSSPHRRASTAEDFAGGVDSSEFEFSARFSGTGAGNTSLGSMISADELFCNGQIRPMNLSSHLQRPQMLSPLLDLEDNEDEEERNPVRGRDMNLRSGSMRRRARSMSPMRSLWDREEEEGVKERNPDADANPDGSAAEMPPSVSSSRSSSTSSSRHSKRWVFLKDLLYRSKSEGRGNAKDKFWNAVSFSPSKEKSSSLRRFKESLKPSGSPAPQKPSSSKKTTQPAPSKPVNAVGKRRSSSQSAHERHYAANRAQAEEMRKKTFLPYRQGLLGCLWFSSRSYGTVNGFARALNPVQSR